MYGWLNGFLENPSMFQSPLKYAVLVILVNISHANCSTNRLGQAVILNDALCIQGTQFPKSSMDKGT